MKSLWVLLQVLHLWWRERKEVATGRGRGCPALVVVASPIIHLDELWGLAGELPYEPLPNKGLAPWTHSKSNQPVSLDESCG